VSFNELIVLLRTEFHQVIKIIEITKDEIKGKIGLMLLGSVERRGRLLPMGTDETEVERMAYKVEEKIRDEVFFFPTLYYCCLK
jgi:creatinine amidohydrolase